MSYSRNYRSRRHTPAATVVLLAAVVFIIRTWRSQEQGPPLSVDSQVVRVVRVVDGDTLLIEGKRRVRLLGVDTPETKHPEIPPEPFGAEASRFTTKLVEGKNVRLEFDRERYDQYQRILAYVFVDDVFLNEELIRAGFSTAQTQYPYRSDMKRRFLQAEKEARQNGRGIWSAPSQP